MPNKATRESRQPEPASGSHFPRARRVWAAGFFENTSGNVRAYSRKLRPQCRFDDLAVPADEYEAIVLDGDMERSVVREKRQLGAEIDDGDVETTFVAVMPSLKAGN
ncbi:MAG: hypothetical protein OXQ90_18720 [Gammaproteobacteria bacterium]|nr:hypothetical protein [Gammaproteobacteria bacterium]